MALCFLYVWLAALDPDRWSNVRKDEHGLIQDRDEEKFWKDEAQSLLQQIVELKKFEEGLKRLKDDKESMLATFAEDNQFGWFGELTQVYETTEAELLR